MTNGVYAVLKAAKIVPRPEGMLMCDYKDFGNIRLLFHAEYVNQRLVPERSFSCISIKETGNPAWPFLPRVWLDDPGIQVLTELTESDLWWFLFTNDRDQAFKMQQALLKDRVSYAKVSIVNKVEKLANDARKALEL